MLQLAITVTGPKQKPHSGCSELDNDLGHPSLQLKRPEVLQAHLLFLP